MWLMGIYAGTGFARVKIPIPLPGPVEKPAQNPRVYPYPCYTLIVIHNFQVQKDISEKTEYTESSQILIEYSSQNI
jgi:hypothetical protein